MCFIVYADAFVLEPIVRESKGGHLSGWLKQFVATNIAIVIDHPVNILARSTILFVSFRYKKLFWHVTIHRVFHDNLSHKFHVREIVNVDYQLETKVVLVLSMYKCYLFSPVVYYSLN